MSNDGLLLLYTHSDGILFPFFRKWYLVLFCTANLLISVLSHLIWRIAFYECMVINPAAHTISHAQEHISFATNRSSVMVCEGWVSHRVCAILWRNCLCCGMFQLNHQTQRGISNAMVFNKHMRINTQMHIFPRVQKHEYVLLHTPTRRNIKHDFI